VGIKLKRYNHKHSCHLVGRDLNVSCDHHALYFLGGIHVPDFEIWTVIVIYVQYSLENMYKYVYSIQYLVTKFHMDGSGCALAMVIRPYLKKIFLGMVFQSARR